MSEQANKCKSGSSHRNFSKLVRFIFEHFHWWVAYRLGIVGGFDTLDTIPYGQSSVVCEQSNSIESCMTSNLAEKRKLPPMLEQYLQYEQRYPECLVFMQVGDFYELFFEHAVTAARVLNVTLTSRDKNSPDPIPMCGVPVASYTSS